MEKNIAALRRDYIKDILKKEDLLENPLMQFSAWFKEAQKAEVLEPNAMSLSTVSPSGRPKSRIVLLKGISDSRLKFFTNYKSQKAKDLEQNPWVSINFFWPELERQVRIEGKVEKTTAEESDIYFDSRPEGSKLGAWASPQSEIIESREIMEENHKSLEKKFKDHSIPRPPHWGGYNVIPDSVEFWQGRASRLHDRFIYLLKNGNWKIERLAP